MYIVFKIDVNKFELYSKRLNLEEREFSTVFQKRMLIIVKT